MARYPGAQWRPLAGDWASQGRIARHDLVILHTMAGSLSGTDSMFHADGYSGLESHFGVGHDDTVYQWQDTDYRADANGAANGRAISIETADYGPGFAKWDLNSGEAVPEWTPAQIGALARLVAWICRTHSIPLVLAADSRSATRGVAFHRLGVVKTRGAKTSQTGGEVWSTAVGKVCPGPRRIAQIPQIIELAGGAAHSSVLAPTSRRDNMLQSFEIEPGSGGRRLVLPIGGNAVVIERAWLSFAVNGPSSGKVRLFYQGAAGQGLSDTGAPQTITFGKGASAVKNFELPAGVAQVVVQWEMPEGGTFTFEGLARA